MTRLLAPLVAALVAAMLAASVGAPPAHAAGRPRADVPARPDTADVAAMRRLAGDVHLPSAPLDTARLARYLDAVAALHADWRGRPAARDSFLAIDSDVELRFWDAESAAEGAAIVARRRQRYAAVPGAVAAVRRVLPFDEFVTLHLKVQSVLVLLGYAGGEGSVRELEALFAGDRRATARDREFVANVRLVAASLPRLEAAMNGPR
jgi:hypothetical protein